MSVDQKELGQRLRAAREACRMTQDEVARRLDLSRSTVAQMELGNLAITGLELERLAYLFGRDMREFFAEEFHKEDALTALFQAHPDVAEQTDVVDALRRCLALGREVTNLERLIGIDGDMRAVASYPLPVPRSKWEAVQQGERVAQEEPHRLQLGVGPLASVTELLETQGVFTARINLPEDISGVTLIEPNVGLFVVANRYRFVSFALEAFRQGGIAQAKLHELAQMVDLGPEELARLHCDMGLGDHEEEGDVLLPEA
jgi:transcriptional regulator with XRE-family HTH domain